MNRKAKQQYCAGCYNDFYNGQGAKECWSLGDAEVVKRWRIGWWTAPTVPGAFEEVTTLTCHHAPGQYALLARLPANAIKPTRSGEFFAEELERSSES